VSETALHAEDDQADEADDRADEVEARTRREGP
jgi:hypothetical protein